MPLVLQLEDPGEGRGSGAHMLSAARVPADRPVRIAFSLGQASGAPSVLAPPPRAPRGCAVCRLTLTSGQPVQVLLADLDLLTPIRSQLGGFKAGASPSLILWSFESISSSSCPTSAFCC